MFIPISSGCFFLLFKEEDNKLSSITGTSDYKSCIEVPSDLYCKMLNMAIEKLKQLKLIEE
jgi:hypothetical protein